jgi:hypothetical protein
MYYQEVYYPKRWRHYHYQLLGTTIQLFIFTTKQNQSQYQSSHNYKQHIILNNIALFSSALYSIATATATTATATTATATTATGTTATTNNAPRLPLLHVPELELESKLGRDLCPGAGG